LAACSTELSRPGGILSSGEGVPSHALIALNHAYAGHQSWWGNIMLPQNSKDYTRNAMEVRGQAENMNAGHERDGLLKLADHWERLAKFAEQQESVEAASIETPEKPE
jgi:hypothetical protein